MRPDNESLRICMLSVEVAPYASTGALGEVLAALPEALRRQGVEVKVVAPLHRAISESSDLERVRSLPGLSINGREISGALFADAADDRAETYFISCPEFFDRAGIYRDPLRGSEYHDNFERYYYFVLAALEALAACQWQPHIIHCHDLHTALLPSHLKLMRMGDPFFRNIATVLTIHNLNYQGLFGPDKFALTGLPQELFEPMGPFEFYGQLNTLKAGICYADKLTTVSDRYARDIQTPQHGLGLEEVLARRSKDLVSIPYGIDTVRWNPQDDHRVAAAYSASDPAPKRQNKRDLQQRCRLPERDVALIGLFSRLADQEGIELFLDAADALIQLPCQWVILGADLGRHKGRVERLAADFPDRLTLVSQYTIASARRIYAGCDMLLMPSYYEPCGLNQMYSMRYGTVPIVRHCGGLADTVSEYQPGDGTGSGFKFFSYDARDLVKTVRRALQLWDADPGAWRQLMHNGMNSDFSWDRSARAYVELYRQALHER